MIADLRTAAAVLERAATDRESLAALGVDDLATAMQLTQTMQRHSRALMLEMTALADARNVAASQGAATTGAWLARTSGVSQREAARELRLAQQLQREAPRTREAMTQPGMSADKARVIAGALHGLPADLDAEQRDAVESDLVDKARRHSLEDLQRAAKRAVEVVDAARADDLEARTLQQEERRARRRTSFWMSRAGDDGMVEGGFTLDALTGDMLRSVLESFAAPRKRACDERAGEVADAATATEAETAEGVVAGDLVAGGAVAGGAVAGGAVADQRDTREAPGSDYPQRLGAAFVEVLRHLPRSSYGNHGGVSAALMVTIDEDALRGRIERAGTTSHGTRISPTELRLIACNAEILPAVLGRDGRVLDVGRSRRLFTTAQRLALAHRDGGCAFPGCDRPPGWCEAHHANPWSTGGSTNLAEGVLVCATDHRRLHHGGWEVRIAEDGQPEFISPARIDPLRLPQRNDRWRPRRSSSEPAA
ncbi:DUF222 domain-containing protein [Mumia sp. DW29H23]|uniref:HNH endonuclease signature motif containing protein n=1 Tax=Mumia sp. DW29H23 TaxID=3421241 RepID=UPI003D696AE3